MRSQPVKLK